MVTIYGICHKCRCSVGHATTQVVVFPSVVWLGRANQNYLPPRPPCSLLAWLDWTV